MFTILLVEDNHAFRQILKNDLQNRFASVDVLEAGDAEQGLEMAFEKRPDLAFIDIRLPGENGFKLTKKLRQKLPGLTIVIFTSHDLPEYRQAAFFHGADCFFTKGSVSRSKMLKYVQSIMNRIGSAPEACA